MSITALAFAFLLSGQAAPLSVAELDAERAGDGETFVMTDQRLVATSTNNRVVADNVDSGDVTIGANGLAFEGVGNFVFNTGHNNTLQSTLSVTILTAPTQP